MTKTECKSLAGTILWVALFSILIFSLVFSVSVAREAPDARSAAPLTGRSMGKQISYGLSDPSVDGASAFGVDQDLRRLAPGIAISVFVLLAMFVCCLCVAGRSHMAERSPTDRHVKLLI